MKVLKLITLKKCNKHDLKIKRLELLTTSRGREFQIGITLTKKECL